MLIRSTVSRELTCEQKRANAQVFSPSKVAPTPIHEVTEVLVCAQQAGGVK